MVVGGREMGWKRAQRTLFCNGMVQSERMGCANLLYVAVLDMS